MYSLLPYNTFGIDVSAARFLEYSSVEELKKLIVQGAIVTPFLHIGGGSNLLFTKDYDGLILHSRIGGIEVTEEDANTLCQYEWEQGLYGMTSLLVAWNMDGMERRIFR